MFARNYDVRKMARHQEGVFAISAIHGPEDLALTWVQGGAESRRLELQEEKRQEEVQRVQTNSFFDLSSHGKPMPTFLRHRFRYAY